LFWSLGGVVYRHKKAILLAWMAIFVAGVFSAAPMWSRLTSEVITDNRFEAIRADRQIKEVAGLKGEVIAVVDEVDVDDPVVAEQVNAAVADIMVMEGVVSALDYYIAPLPMLVSEDGNATLVMVNISNGLSDEDAVTLAERVGERLRSMTVGKISVGGSLLFPDEFVDDAVASVWTSLKIALPLLILLVVLLSGFFVSFVLWGGVFIAITGGLVAVLLSMQFVGDLPIFVLGGVGVLGIGVTLASSFLVLFRFREEIARHPNSAETAIMKTVATAGKTVVMAGGAVILCLLLLAITFDVGLLRTLVLGGVPAAFLGTGVALTFVPAALTLWGHRSRFVKRFNPTKTGRFFSLGELLANRAPLVTSGVLIFFFLLIIPLRSATIGLNGPEVMPDSPGESRRLIETIQERFPLPMPAINVFLAAPLSSPEVKMVLQELSGMEEVESAMPRLGVTGDGTIIDVTQVGTTQSAGAQEIIRSVRTLDLPVQMLVGGPTALLVDFKDHLSDRLPILVVFTALVVGLLVFLLTTSLIMPFLAIAVAVVAVYSSIGVTILLLDKGRFAGSWGYESVLSLDILTILLVPLVVGVTSLQIVIFLLGRMVELRSKGGVEHEPIIVTHHVSVAALHRTGGAILSVALLLCIVYTSLALGDLFTLAQVGLGAATAIFVAGGLMLLLMPALAALTGENAWWAPALLQRFAPSDELRLSGESPVPIPLIDIADSTDIHTPENDLDQDEDTTDSTDDAEDAAPPIVAPES